MADLIQPNRVSAQIDGDFVVFLIGMRINKIWKVHKWLPTFKAMTKMLRELTAAPAETGFLGFSRLGPTTLVQYWQSFEHLERYARSRDYSHWPAWVEFNRQMKNSRGDVGIWHETYLVQSGQYEAITFTVVCHFSVWRRPVARLALPKKPRVRDSDFKWIDFGSPSHPLVC